MIKSHSPVRVGPLQRKYVRQAGRLLAAVFDRDPVIGHFMPRSAKRRLVLPGFFRSSLEEAYPLGTSTRKLSRATYWVLRVVPT